MIHSLEYYIPEKKLSNEDISRMFPAYSANKIGSKIGVSERRVVSEGEFATDLAIGSAKKLLEKNKTIKSKIDYLLYCTQSPDFILPTNACLIQNQLGLNNNLGAIDINQGCSGYIYGLSLAQALLDSCQAKNILLITSDTYTRYITETDFSNKTIFGDASSATLLSEKGKYKIGNFSLGTDGSGFDHLIVRNSGIRGFNSKKYEIYMDGPKIFEFTIKKIPGLINDILQSNQTYIDEVDAFVFHQANKFMLEHLRKKIGIPSKKFVYQMELTGNTVSSTIPIALKSILNKNYKKILLCGFGVGLSWGGTILTLNNESN